MKIYTSDNAVFKEEIMIVETTDPAHADNVNEAPKQLLQNTIDNREYIQSVEQAAKDYSDATYQQATGYTDHAIADLIGGAPELRNTLKELSDAIDENEDVADTLNEAIGKKADQGELDGHIKNDTIHVTATKQSNWDNKMEKTGDSKDNTVSFTSADTADPTAWTVVAVLKSGEKHNSILNKISAMIKNTRFLKKKYDELNTNFTGSGAKSITITKAYTLFTVASLTVSEDGTYIIFAWIRGGCNRSYTWNSVYVGSNEVERTTLPPLNGVFENSAALACVVTVAANTEISARIQTNSLEASDSHVVYATIQYIKLR